ncbi:Ig-like domain-containing protein [Vibrio sp. 10N.222.54.B12]|uniref:Ig-like domain-containing protein n=1 Tax=unclassified Vibrio TaxID=2614977 RepID=UPI0010BE13A5|nr:Ig-like domain-containing protein [Vibrio sp. F13]TKG10492.1 DUF4165 domain-containing protein [Vibrio sp. F13]
MKFRLCFLSICLTASGLAHSAIEGFEFTDTLGISKLVKTNTAESTLINNVGQLGVHVSAGLDRRIRVNILQNGVAVTNSTGNVITVNDSQSPFNSEYFGSLLNVSIPSEGSFTVQAQTLSLDGEVVNSETTNIIRDVTPPASDDMSVKYMYGGYVNSMLPAGSWYLSAQMGSYTSTIVEVKNVSDTSGIDNIEMETFTFDAEDNRIPYKSKSLAYTESKLSAEINLSANSTLFPVGNAIDRFQTRTKISDKAGNVTYTAYQDVYWDSLRTDTLEAVGVLVPGSSNVIGGLTGFQPYVRDMEVDTNPVTVLYRVADWNFRDDSGSFDNAGGIWASGANAVYTDRGDGFIYFVDTSPAGAIGISWRNQAHYRNVTGPSLYSVTLSDSARQTPVPRYGQYYYSDTQDWGSWSRRVYNDELPVQIERIRLFVNARSYPQIAYHAGHSCSVPTGQDVCDVILSSPWTMTAGGSAYYHSSFTVRSEDQTLSSNPTYPVGSYNDRYYPSVEETSFNEDTKVLSVRVELTCHTCYQNRIYMDRYELQDADGNKLNVSRFNSTVNSTTFEGQYNLTELPEGTHEVYVYARERHGPDTRKHAVTYVSDKTAPSILMGYDGSTLSDQVTDLRKVTFTVSDSSSINDITVSLRGSRYDIDYQLGYSLIEETVNSQTYQLELPKLFPTLDENEIYSLSVVAADEFSNTNSILRSFSYKPENLIVMDTIDYLASQSNTPLYLSNGKPMAIILTERALTLENSMLATGDQQGEITNNASSDFPIRIQTKNGWVEVTPGETKDIVIDLGNGDPLYVEVYPVSDNNNGQADFLFNLPQLSSAYID